MNPIPKSNRLVTVFCGSSSRVDGHFLESARLVARLLYNSGVGIVYGGGGVGMMGALADEMLALGGEIRGVIPRFMIEREWAHPKVRKMDIVDTMIERKARMLELGDLILALPGGMGTLDELFEAATLRQLGCLRSPVLIFNPFGYFDLLLELQDHMRDKAFIGESGDSWRVLSDIDALRVFIETWLREGLGAEVTHASV